VPAPARSRSGRQARSVALGATAITIGLIVIACATGTERGDTDIEGGVEPADASRDLSVVPRDSAAGDASSSGDSGACNGKVVINELSPSTSASASVEFIELYNPSTCAVPLGNWRIPYRSSTGGGTGVLHTFAVGDSILAKTFLVLGTSGFTGKKDATFNGGMADNGQIALQDDTGKTIDSVGYGSSTGVFVEKSPAPAAPANGSVGRKADGIDSDNNATDFKTFATPSAGAQN